MIQSKLLSGANGVRHGFFTREGGFSTGLYHGLNCGPGSDDDSHTVMRNRAQVESRMELAQGMLVTLFQCHSAKTVTVQKTWPQGGAPKADSMVTNRAGTGLGILTADCVPVLFADNTARIIGAAHAGWKGAIGGVLESTIDAMVALGSTLEQIHACIGPCIRQESYEVGDDLRTAFLAGDNENTRFFAEGVWPGHYQFDLAGYVKNRLDHCSIGAVDDVHLDTCTNEQQFYSYRRMVHRNEPDYGRQISVITLDQRF